MESIQSKARAVPPYRSPLFWGIVFFVSFFIFAIVSMMQRVSGFSEGWKNFLESYEVLISLACGVGIALFNWFISYVTNRPSKLEEQNFISQHLRSEYVAGEQHFIKMFGKKTADYPFTYISEQDLPVIYAKLYEEDRLIEKGKLSVNKELVEVLKHYFVATEHALEGFFQAYNKEALKESPNPNLKEGYVFQVMEYLHRNLIYLHQNLGVKFVALNDASIKTYAAAYFETLHLIDYLGGDFKELRDSIVERESTDKTNSQEDLQMLFGSANEIARELMGTSGDPTFEAFSQGVQIRHIIKQATGTKLYSLALQVLHDIVDSLMDSEPTPKPVEEEDTYPSCSFYNQTEDKCLTLRYQELENNTLLLTLVGGDKDVGAVVKFIDEEQTKYMIDRDMGAFFITECKKQITTHLN